MMQLPIHIVVCRVMAVFLVMGLVACAEVIDLETETEGGQIVIYGRITNGTQGNEIRVTKTGFFGQQPGGIVGATVTVEDGKGNQGIYTDLGEGNYEMQDVAFVGLPGERYSLRIELPSGDTYVSRPEVMPEVSAKDSLYFRVQEIEETSNLGVTSTREVVSVYSDTEIFNARPDLFIKWNVEEVYAFEQAVLPTHNFPWYFRHTCYMTEELEGQRVLLYDGSELRTSRIGGQEITNRYIDENFRGVHFFNLIQQSLTSGAHQFWSGLDQNTNRVGSIFDQPPGALSSNIYKVDAPEETVFGYFEVMAVDTARLRVTNRDIDRFFPEPCPVNPEVDFAPFMCFPCIERYYEPECLNCLILPNSSHKRPTYID